MAKPDILSYSPLAQLHAYAKNFKALFPRMVNLVFWSVHARECQARRCYSDVPAQGPTQPLQIMFL